MADKKKAEQAPEPDFYLYPPPRTGGNPGPEIAKAMIAAYKDGTGYVQKTGRGDGLKYKFAGEADLIGAIRPAMVDQGLTAHVVAMDSLEIADHGQTRGGNTMRDVKLRITVRFLHVSGEYIDVQAYGEGSDTGDKAVAKAMTIAYKYCLRQAFMVETGDDPDIERPEEKDPPARQPAKKPKPAPDPEPAPEPSGDPDADLDNALWEQVKDDLKENKVSGAVLAVAIDAEAELPTRKEILDWLRGNADDIDVARVNLMSACSRVKSEQAGGD